MTSLDSLRSTSEDAQKILLGEGYKGHSSAMTSSSQLWKQSFPEIVGRCQTMQMVLESVAKIARSEGAVLIHGESGTGKELIASAIHRLSLRSHKRFVAINCSAIPESLLESELFGHEKGAFTGAVGRRAGHFEMAAGGTLFLDEIGDMPMRLQAKLLRVLQERTFTPVGGSEQKSADVRIVAATNIDLEKAVNQGQFRLDLFYRLNVLPVQMPALRDRGEDIPQLLDYFLGAANRNHQLQNPCYFTSEVVQILQGFSWPGNVRELQNLVERLVIMVGGGPVLIDHLPTEYRKQSPRAQLNTPSLAPRDLSSFDQTFTKPSSSESSFVVQGPLGSNRAPKDFGKLPDEGMNLSNFISELENSLIVQALERTGQNRNQAAKLLGLNRTTLVERIKKRRILVNDQYCDSTENDDLPFLPPGGFTR